MKRIFLNQEELAGVLGLSRQAVSSLEKSGVIKREPQTFKFDAFPTVTAYITRIRPLSSTGKPGGRPRRESDLSAEKMRWEIQKLKTHDLKWRRGHAEAVAEALTQALSSSLAVFRDKLAGGTDAATAAREMEGALADLDLSAIVDRLEDAYEEREEEQAEAITEEAAEP